MFTQRNSYPFETDIFISERIGIIFKNLFASNMNLERNKIWIVKFIYTWKFCFLLGFM